MVISAGIVLGKVLRKVAHTLIKKYYPKILITGADEIPSEGPVLFCANHPNSLIDPLLIGITARRPVSFMAKAPLFKTPVIGPILHALGMVPAYRGSDDTGQVKKNQKSLRRVVNGLKSGRAMGIFPEGVSTDLRQLGLVRGGAARIALEAFEQGVDNLVIVPLGINYECKERLGSKVWINVGVPIKLWQFTEEHQTDAETPLTEDKVLRRQLTRQIETNLKSVVVHLDNADWDPLLDDLETLIDYSKHKASLKVPKLLRRKRIADALNYFYREEPEVGEEIISQVRKYHRKVKSQGLVIDDPILQRSTLKTTFTFFWKLFHLIIWFIPALVGTLGNIVPFVITRAIVAKVQHPGKKTTALARIGSGIPIYLLWYACIAYNLLQETAQPALITVTNFLLVLSGTIALKYWPYFTRTMVHLGHQVRASLRRSSLLRLRRELSEIRATLIQYAERYAQIFPRPEPRSIKPLIMLFASTVSSLLLLSFAFVFYILVNLYLNPEVADELRQPVASTDVVITEKSTLDAEQQVLRIAKQAAATHKHSLDLLQQYKAGNFQVEHQDNRREVSALLHSFYQARDELVKIAVVYSPEHYNTDYPPQVSRRRLMQLYTAAMLLRHQMSLRFAATYLQDTKLSSYLNERDDTFGIPEGLVRRVNEELEAGLYKELMATIGEQYLEELKRYGSDDSPNADALSQLIEKANQTIQSVYEKHPDPLPGNVRTAISEAVRKGVSTYLQLQQMIATEIGDFRIKNTREIREHHIRSQEVNQFHGTLRPGDILIERRDWYSSNAFLPGYWPHGALYVGSPSQWKQEGILEKVITELQVLADLATQSGSTRETDEPHQQNHAEKIQRLIEQLKAGEAEHLDRFHIIEAVSEGVILNTVAHSIGEASSVFALRPKNLKPGERAKAIAHAFYYEGREYDFNFDFETPNTLVCTEVIYRCYGGNSDNATLRFPIVSVLGRRTLPAHELATQFVQDVRTGNPQYDLVAWLDYDRIQDEATVRVYLGNHTGADFEEFAKTLTRSSITFVMEYKKHGLIVLVGEQVIILFYLSVLTACGYAIVRFVLHLRSSSPHPHALPEAP